MIEDLINKIDSPNRDRCLNLLNDNYNRFLNSPGSAKKHQNWVGGYIDHIEETMNMAIILYHQMNSIRTLKFTISDVLLVLFLHDLEKPFKYVDPSISFTGDDAKLNFILIKCQQYSIGLSDDHLNALKYIHGEGNDYCEERVQGPLAAFAHVCDVISARIWFDYPE